MLRGLAFEVNRAGAGSLTMTFDPFEILGLARRFDLTSTEVEGAYLARAAGVHPDLADAGDADADARSAELNAARRTLLDPEQRANALLELLGGPRKEQDKSLPEGFLAKMMEMREQMDEARASGDARAMAAWRAWAENERRSYVERASAMFAEVARMAGDAPSRPAALAQIRREINAWRYVERMFEQMGAADGI